MWVAFTMEKLLPFIQQKNINIFAIFQHSNFNVRLANNFNKFWTTRLCWCADKYYNKCLDFSHLTQTNNCSGYWPPNRGSVKLIFYAHTDTVLTCRRLRWLSWMHRPTGDQEVAGSTPAEVGNILSWRLIVKYFYGHSLPSADSRRAVVSFWRKNVHNTG